MYKLTEPPYLQIALDLVDEEEVKKIVGGFPSSKKILIEAGTPLIKACGISIIRTLRKLAPENVIVADMKTMDVGKLEVQLALKGEANASAVAGAAPLETIKAVIREAHAQGMYAVLDTINVCDVVELLKKLEEKPDIVELHRGIDEECTKERSWEVVEKIKKLDKTILVAVAGGMTLESVPEALKHNVDIVVVGRGITAQKEPAKEVEKFLKLLG
ncbi:MAG: orotidine 5'-phosphate decarboxylase / HUMPS family protein [Candidatus Micrarchaeota archaeon]